MSKITTKDGTRIYYKDWGTGHPVVFSHGWPLSADAWESPMVYLASNGYRCVAHDRRGHCRSSQPWDGNDMDTYADDLAALIETLNLNGATLVGHSAGGGEVARYIERHGTNRVVKAAMVAKDFLIALDFFKRVGRIAQAEDHHPDLHLTGYRNVTIELSTHDLGGLSENDFIVAAKINQLPVKLKE